MENKIYRYIVDNHMLKEKDEVLVGLSGGADSVCLLMVLIALKKRLDIDIRCVHINHMIRGDEAIRDENFCRELCKEHEVEFEAFRIDIPKLSKENGQSLEEAGRSERYRIFGEMCKPNTRIATAHHGNDQAETVLHNLVRGSGIKGLAGIRPVNDNIIRPLLCVTRKDIEEYLSDKGVSYVTDSTNASLEYMRNRLRHVVLPYLTNEINADAISNINDTAVIMSEAEEFLEKCTKESYNKSVKYNGVYEIDSKVFETFDVIIKKYVIRKVFEGCFSGLKDVTKEHVDSVNALFEKTVGKTVNLPQGVTARRDYDRVIIGKYDASFSNNECGLPQYKETVIDWNSNMSFEKNDYTKYFDYDTIKGMLELRTRKAGDYIVVNKQGGKKKLKDYFIDEKIPADKRDSIPVFAVGSHILWVVGYRISEDVKITSTTTRVLKIDICTKEDNL